MPFGSSCCIHTIVLDNGPDFHTPPSQCTLLDPLPVVCLNTICSWQGVTFKYLTKQVMGKTKIFQELMVITHPDSLTLLVFSSEHFKKLALFRQILVPQDLSF